MKGYVWSKDGMKQVIDSGWKEFDRQTNCIVSGSAVCNTQYSSFIRPWKDTECDGMAKKPGELMNFDMNLFRDYRMPDDIKGYLVDRKRSDSVILYMFFIIGRCGVRPFSWVITDRHHRLVKYRVVSGLKENYDKRVSATKEAIKYITV